MSSPNPIKPWTAGDPISAAKLNRMLAEAVTHISVQGESVRATRTGNSVSILVGKQDHPINPGDLVVVRVEKTGGADGTASTPASWTYSIYPKSTSLTTAIATGVAVVRPRPNGMMTFQASNTGYGLAFKDGADWKLWDAGEIPNTATCA